MRKLLVLLIATATVMSACSNGRMQTDGKGEKPESAGIFTEIPETLDSSIENTAEELEFEDGQGKYTTVWNPAEHGSLVINEAVLWNANYKSFNGEYYDWTELKNTADTSINLGDYYISDDVNNLCRFRLPDRELKPGELIVIFLSGHTELSTDKYIHAPFSLDAVGEELFISDTEGNISDCTFVEEPVFGCSMGRDSEDRGFVFFKERTPGEDNPSGYSEVAEEPLFSIKEGVYEDVAALCIELSGEGKIYYTTNGKDPVSEGILYTDPIVIENTTIICAVSVVEGKLDSKCVSASYIINEGHSIPVTSIICGNLFRELYPDPEANKELPCRIAFFDGEDGFSVSCGIKLHGATSRNASKKSFKLMFRDRYDGKLRYELFEGNEIKTFESVLLRAAMESTFSTHMRDILAHSLAAKMSGELPTEDYRFTVLYINGKYQGIYSYREAHSASFYSEHYGYDKSDITMHQGDWNRETPGYEWYKKALNGDISDIKVYNEVSGHFNISSIIDWLIIEGYLGNIDINPPNFRMYYSASDEMIRYGLVDMDLSGFDYYSLAMPLDTPYKYSVLGKVLLGNTVFRQEMIEKLSEYLHGPLSDDNVINEISKIAAIIRPEIARDGEKWGYSQQWWEKELDYYLYGPVKDSGNHYPYSAAYMFADTARGCLGMSKDEFEQWFGDIEKTNPEY